MRFMQLLADALIGDLKNNITMSSSGGIRLIRSTFTESQIPELVKAGIDVFIEQSGNWHYDWNESLVDGKYINEQIRIDGSGMKTVTVHSQDVRPMNAAEQEAWENNTLYEIYGDQFYSNIYFDHQWYISLSNPETSDSYTVPATREDFDENHDPFDMPIKKITINYLRGEAEIDEQGNMLSLEGSAKIIFENIFGETNLVELNVSANFTDIGTSKPICPIPGAKQLLTQDYMKNNFGIRRYGDVYFTLNEDGSINANSVTTTYPGENDINNYYED
jgi:hypothetical protein